MRRFENTPVALHVVYLNGTWHMTYFDVDGGGKGRVLDATATRPGGPWTKRGVILESTKTHAPQRSSPVNALTAGGAIRAQQPHLLEESGDPAEVWDGHFAIRGKESFIVQQMANLAALHSPGSRWASSRSS